MRISKSGNDVFTEYTYDKGRLSSIIDYQGSEKSASSEVIRSMTFGYNNQNKATYIKGFDTTTETKSNFDYTLEYDVTDMESYTVYTLDKAYNMTLADEAEIEDISDRSKAEAVKKLINDLPEDVKLSDKANI